MLSAARTLRRAAPGAARALSSAEVASAFDTLAEALPDLSPGPAGPAPAAQVTALPNGVRVVSQDDGAHCASVGAFVEGGARHESAGTLGAAHVLRHSGFKSTTDRSALRFFRDMEDAGIVASCSGDREHLVYRADCLRDNAFVALGFVADTLTKPYLPGYEVTESKTLAGHDSAAAAGSVQSLVDDLLHATAFGPKSPLGLSANADPTAAAQLNGDALRGYRDAVLTGDRVVVVATGADHDSVVRYAETAFADIPAGPGAPQAAAAYQGGDKRVEAATGGDVHVAIALDNGVGGFKSGAEKGVLAALALQTMLGGGVGTAGARLTGAVTAEQFGAGAGASAFAATYADAGLVGVFGSAPGANAAGLVGALCAELKGAAAAAPSDADVARARNQLKATVGQNLSTRGGVFADLGTQVLATGGVQSAGELFAKIDALTGADIQGAAKAALASGPTVVAVGAVDDVPSYPAIQSMLT